jgi:uncharacterized protein (TIGR01619 family)
MSDEWDFYFTNVNDVVASLFVDLGIHDSVPDPHRPWLLWSSVYFQHQSDNGLSTSDEASILYQIEDALTQAVEESTEAELVGRITTDGRMELYFYGPRSAGFEEAVANALKSFPEYEFDAGAQKDPEWSQYMDVLYPTPEEHQRIANRRVIDNLEEHGDSLKAPRPVSHWIYFKTSEDRSQFVAATVSSGFKVINEFVNDDKEPEYLYCVTLERVDHVDWNSINDVTLHLFRLAEQFGGDYDGWETSVEADG